MTKLPKDISPRVIGSTARAIVHRGFNATNWEYREETGCDVGIDCSFDLIEHENWTGDKLFCQVKGTTKPKYICDNKYISVELKVSTLNYALSHAFSFVVLYVDINTDIIYYLPIQEYFIANKSLFYKLESGQDKISLHVPTDNIVSNDNINLIEIAKSRYVGGPGKDLHRAL